MTEAVTFIVSLVALRPATGKVYPRGGLLGPLNMMPH